MSKFCIFCGNKPKNKTKEHVIPQWLIKMTDHKERKTIFGRGSNGEISFPWMQYTFPACKDCNENYSNLEGRLKPIIENLLLQNEITQANLLDLLDWLDKVRVGIWLGQSLLSGEKLNPNFHINQRVGISDRLLIIYQSIEKDKGITFTGTESLAFKYSPSCFALTINELTFFNYSSAFLLSENMGFPFPNEINTHPNGKLEIPNIDKGKLKITRPLLEGKIISPSVKIYQTILDAHGGNIIESPIPEYIIENSIKSTPSNIKSHPFIIDDFSDYFDFLKDNETIRFRLKGGYPKDALMNSTALIVFNHQNYEIERSLKTFNHLPNKEKEKHTSLYNFILNENKKLIAKLEE